MYRFNSAEVRHHAEKYAYALLDKTIDDMSWDFKDVEHIMNAHERQVQAVINQPDSVLSIIKSIVTDNKLIMGASVAFDKSTSGDFMIYVALDSLNNLNTRYLTDANSYDYSSMPWYVNAKSGGQRTWSEPYFDSGCGDRLMTTYSIPIKNASGAVCAVLTADVSLLELDKEINSIRSFKDDFTFVLSGEGNYVVHSKWSAKDGTELYNVATVNDGEDLLPIYKKMLAGEKGMANVTLNGDDVLVCYAPLLVSDWSICYVCPYNSILASLNSFTVSIEGTLLIVLLLLIAAMWVIIKREIRPAEKLTEATYAISKGDFDSKLPEIKTKDEFKRLHDAFEVMQTSLKQYIADLTAITEAKQKIQSELRIAHDIQMHLIPTINRDLHYPQVDIDALLRPAKEVGGDFYDYFYIDNQLYFTIADVSGKGVPAALIMATTRAHFRMISRTLSSPSKIVTALNDALCVDNDANMFVTMFLGIIDLNSNSFRFCNAGHCPGIIVGSGNAEFMDVTPNLPLGVLQGFEYKEQSVQLNPGSVMLFYTDGLTEAENTKHEMLGEDNILPMLNDANTQTASEMVECLAQSVEKFADGAPQSDDLTLFCVKYNRVLHLQNNLQEVEKLYNFINDCLKDLILDDDKRTNKINMLHLALEEALVNVINYAYPDGEVGNITLTAEQHQDSLIFRLFDKGKPFDPTAIAAPDTQASLDERKIGGLGIHLVRNIMDSVSYEYADNYNILIMTCNIKS